MRELPYSTIAPFGRMKLNICGSLGKTQSLLMRKLFEGNDFELHREVNCSRVHDVARHKFFVAQKANIVTHQRFKNEHRTKLMR